MPAHAPQSGSEALSTRPRGVRLACARCGYDLSGVVDAWVGSCPVEGVCSECGLGFGWRDVFDPLRDVPKWFFELAEKRPVGSLCATALRTLAPWRLWREVTMAMPLRPLRLGAFAATGLTASWLTIASVLVLVHGCLDQGMFVYMAYLGGNRPLTLRTLGPVVLRSLRWPLTPPMPLRRLWGGYPFVEAWWSVLALVVIAPLCFVLFGQTLGRVRVMRRHVVRAGVFVGMSTLMLYSSLTIVRGGLEYSLSAHMVGPNRNSHPWWVDFAFFSRYREHDLTALLVVWVCVSWWIVCRRYFRIEHPFWVALAITTVAAVVVLFPLLLGTHVGADWHMWHL